MKLYSHSFVTILNYIYWRDYMKDILKGILAVILALALWDGLKWLWAIVF